MMIAEQITAYADASVEELMRWPTHPRCRLMWRRSHPPIRWRHRRHRDVGTTGTWMRPDLDISVGGTSLLLCHWAFYRTGTVLIPVCAGGALGVP